MKNRTNTILLILFLIGSLTQTVSAQEIVNRNWDSGKIKGVRFVPYPSYMGMAFMSNAWLPGKVEFTSGEIADSLFLRYSSFKDEIVYYNKPLSAQIVIDKASLNGFTITDELGKNRLFTKKYYDGFISGDRYFEVLSHGETDLLAFRNVILTTTMLYTDEDKVVKNMDYEKNYAFYFYSPEHGYTPVRMNMTALLSKFDKTLKKPIKKLLRKNRIKVSGEDSFTDAWKVIEKEGYKVAF